MTSSVRLTLGANFSKYSTKLRTKVYPHRPQMVLITTRITIEQKWLIIMNRLFCGKAGWIFRFNFNLEYQNLNIWLEQLNIHSLHWNCALNNSCHSEIYHKSNFSGKKFELMAISCCCPSNYDFIWQIMSGYGKRLWC